MIRISPLLRSIAALGLSLGALAMVPPEAEAATFFACANRCVDSCPANPAMYCESWGCAGGYGQCGTGACGGGNQTVTCVKPNDA